MKFQYLGTAAAEGWPAIFCRCDACREAQRLGGKNIRTRSQAIINDDLLIDLPPDTYMHKLFHGLDLTAVKYLLITHCHMDHFYPQELTVRGSGYSHDMVSPDLHIYCAQETYDLFRRCAEWESDKESLDAMHWHILKAFEPVQAGPYTITPLPANHMNSSFEPFIYHISDSEGTSVYYLHDSGYYAPEVWAYFKKQKPADLISLDTTCGELDLKLQGTHMGINDVIKVCGEMREVGLADAHTRCVMNHFSHNGHLMHHEMEALAVPVGMEVSFDGMRIDL